MQLIDEENDLALRLLNLLEHGLESVLELASVLGSSDEGPEIERHDPLVLQGLGDVPRNDALGETFHDRGLAYARLPDEDGVVLGAPRQNLNHATDLVVAADDRIELAAPGLGRQVPGVALESLVAVLGVGVVDALVAADLAEGGDDAVSLGAQAPEALAGGSGRLGESEQ